jgi:hypothetical protein
LSAERRLAALEASLSPTELVLRWLAEAHAYDAFTTYTQSLFDQDPSDLPMDRLAREAQTSARSRSRGQPKEDVAKAVRKALLETMFRAQLVLRINALTQDVIDREVLIDGALSAHLGLAVHATRGQPIDKGPIGLVLVRDLLFARVTELHAFEAARTTVERKHLDGVTALFPAAVRDWAEQRTRSETLAVTAFRIAELDGFDPPPPDDEAAFDARVTQLVADHVEPARSKAYYELGDGRRALTIAIGWLRPKTKLLSTDAGSEQPK